MYKDIKRLFEDKEMHIEMREMLAQNYQEAQYRAKAYRYMGIINAAIKKLQELQDNYWVNQLGSDFDDKQLKDIPGFNFNYPFKCEVQELKAKWGEYDRMAATEDDKEKDLNE